MTAVAGGKVFASDTTTLAASTTGKPFVKLIQQVAQSIPDNADTVITFGAGSEDADTHGWHDLVTNTGRITPIWPRPARYRLTATLFLAAPGSGITFQVVGVAVFLNGAAQTPRMRAGGPAMANLSASVQLSLELTANGTTDYFEMAGYQRASTAAAKTTNVGGSFASVFECEYIRDL